MPINPNVPASEYTQYLRERSTIVSRKWVPPDFSKMFYNSQIFHARVVRGLIRPSISTPSILPLPYGLLNFQRAGTIDIAPKTSLNLGNGDFTIEFFFIVTNSSGGLSREPIFSFSSGSSSNFTVYRIATDIIVTNSGFEGASVGYGFQNVIVNRWYHGVVQVSSGIITVLLNGQNMLMRNSTFEAIPNGSKLVIGGHPVNNDNNFRLSSTSISNFRVTKGTALYATSYTRPTLSLSGIGSSLLLLATADNPYGDSSSDSANTVITIRGTAPTRSPGPITFA